MFLLRTAKKDMGSPPAYTGKFIIGKTKKDEPILKVCFPTLDMCNEYFAQRKKLIKKKDLWMREDLTKLRQHLAWLVTRKSIEHGQFYRTWTSMGVALVAVDQKSKQVRLDCPNDIDRLGKPAIPREEVMSTDYPNVHLAPNSLSLPESSTPIRVSPTIMSDQGLLPSQ